MKNNNEDDMVSHVFHIRYYPINTFSQVLSTSNKQAWSTLMVELAPWAIPEYEIEDLRLRKPKNTFTTLECSIFNKHVTIDKPEIEFFFVVPSTALAIFRQFQVTVVSDHSYKLQHPINNCNFNDKVSTNKNIFPVWNERMSSVWSDLHDSELNKMVQIIKLHQSMIINSAPAIISKFLNLKIY